MTVTPTPPDVDEHFDYLPPRERPARHRLLENVRRLLVTSGIIGRIDAELPELFFGGLSTDLSVVERDGLAEFVTVPARVLEPLPDGLGFVTGAAWPVAFTTAWRMIVTAGRLRPAETALVLGASGGVGHAALQLAGLAGATVYATTSSTEKAGRLADHADEVIDYTERLFDEVVAELTDGRGVDLVADHVGQETWQRSIDSLATGGRMVICGATSGADPDLDIRSVYQRHRQIRGAPMGNREEFRTVLELVADGRLEPIVDRVLPLERIAAGHRTLVAREVVGKVVIEPNN